MLRSGSLHSSSSFVRSTSPSFLLQSICPKVMTLVHRSILKKCSLTQLLGLGSFIVSQEHIFTVEAHTVLQVIVGLLEGLKAILHDPDAWEC